MPIEKGEIERREGTEESFEEERVVKEKTEPEAAGKVGEKSIFQKIIEFLKGVFGK